MFEKIRIENFRCFKSFELDQLGRVNLLVGTNNSRKTSALEATQLLCSRTNLDPLYQIMKYRGEYITSDSNRKVQELDIRHLFYGHQIKSGEQFSIIGYDQISRETLNVTIKPIVRQLSLFENETEKESSIGLPELSFSLKYYSALKGEDELQVLLSPDSGLSIDDVRRSQRRINEAVSIVVTQFVRSSSLSASEMVKLFDLVVLTPQELLVQEALQVIDKKIERIASVKTNQFRYDSNIRDGFVIRVSNSSQRVLIDSFGDGTWRMLGLALSTVCAEGGVLLVDEIDTGLHFTAMADMWKLIWETAKKLNVQVFATTHNSDCWTSLASIVCQDDAAKEGITIQRIERDKEKAVAFTDEEIVIAAERGIEVR